MGCEWNATPRPPFPSLEEIESERYGLAKVIYVYHIAPASPAIQAAIDYLTGAEGRAAIEATDVWPIPSDRVRVSTVR